MTSSLSISETGRWVLVIVTSIVSFVATIYFDLILRFSPFPKDLVEPTAGFLMGLIFVFTGSILAPRHRFRTAMVLLIFGTVLATTILRFHLLGTISGGIIAILLVAWLFHPRRTSRSFLWMGVVSSLAFLLFLGVVYARYVDRPAHTASLPPEIFHALGSKASLVTGFYRYDLGGFIDHEWLWRIDAKPEVVAFLVSDFGLSRTSAVSKAFFRMPPYYWPRSMPTNAEAFQSPLFSADSRGPDGKYYFLLQDKTQNRVFVWLKDNF